MIFVGVRMCALNNCACALSIQK